MGLTRRVFLIAGAAAVGGVAVGAYLYRQPFDNPLTGFAPDGVALNPYVLIGADGRVSVVAPRAEMGQGSQSALAKLVAEELDVDFEAVEVLHGPASRAYLNWRILGMSLPFAEDDKGLVAETARGAMHVASKVLGHQITGGSTSIIDGYQPMREAGAMVRALLMETAAERLRVPVGTLTTNAGFVVAGDRRVAYGDLARDAARRPAPTNVSLKLDSAFKLIGHTVPRKDIPPKVTGAARFGIDARPAGVVHGAVRLNPSAGGALTRLDAAAAKQKPGVIDVIDVSGAPWGGAYAVLAKTTWHAFEALDAVSVDWASGPGPKDTAAIDKVLETALTTSGYAFTDEGDVAAALGGVAADKRIEAVYRAPPLAHACLEPMNATALYADGVFTVWTGTQVPTLVQAAAAAEFGVKAEDVVVHVDYLGGGFGRRLEVDYAVLALRAARARPGTPIKLTFPRVEDMTHDMVRPPAAARMTGAVGADGLPVALSARVAAPSVAASFVGRVMPHLPLAGPDKLIAEGVYDQPIAIPNRRVEGVAAPLALEVGNWRSVGHSCNAFFHEGFMDELARLGGIDPIELRLKRLTHAPHARAVVEAVARLAAWTGNGKPGMGRGFAMNRSFGSTVAEIIDVVETPQGLKVEAVYVAIDVGRAIDPGSIVAQCESAVIFGLSAAIHHAVTHANGQVVETNFDQVEFIRIDRCPRITVEVLQSQPEIGGVGEPATAPVAPALANAIFDLTGKRLRALPLKTAVAFA